MKIGENVASRKLGIQSVTSNRNAGDLCLCKWLQAPAIMNVARSRSPLPVVTTSVLAKGFAVSLIRDWLVVLLQERASPSYGLLH